jgi:integrase/recombinase XerD
MYKAYLEPTDVAVLEKVATNLRDRLLIRLLFRLGCRVSEALSLTVEDIDFTAGTARIQHLKSRLELNCTACGARLGKNHAFCPRCGINVKEAVTKQQEYHKVRTLPLDKETLEILKDYINRGGPIKRGDKALIFGISRHRAWQIIKECAERAKLPKLVNPDTGRVHNVSPHRLRDAFATHAIKLNDSGDGLRLLQEHLGHASFNTTAKYRKVAGEELKDWYQKLWQQPDTKTDGGKLK